MVSILTTNNSLQMRKVSLRYRKPFTQSSPAHSARASIQDQEAEIPVPNPNASVTSQGQDFSHCAEAALSFPKLFGKWPTSFPKTTVGKEPRR